MNQTEWKKHHAVRLEGPPGSDFTLFGWKRFLPPDVDIRDKISVKYSDGTMEENIRPSEVWEWFDSTAYFKKGKFVTEYRIINRD